jgi:hypothetical protein
MIKVVDLPLHPGRACHQPAPVQGQRVRHCIWIRHIEVEEPPHLSDRQIEAAQPADQPGQLDLLGAVAPVAAGRVHERRGQEADGVIVPQRLRGQPARTSELADAQQALRRIHAQTVRIPVRGRSNVAIRSLSGS